MIEPSVRAGADLIDLHLPVQRAVRQDLHSGNARLESPGAHPTRHVLPTRSIQFSPQVVAGGVVEAVLGQIILQTLQEDLPLQWLGRVLQKQRRSKAPVLPNFSL